MIAGVSLSFQSNRMLHKTQFRPNLSSKNSSAQISHAHQIVGGTGEGKEPVHSTDSTMTQLPQERNRLQPPKTFFDPLPPLLTQSIAQVTCRAPVNRAPAIPLQVLCDRRSHSQVATLRHKISRVEALVASHRHLLSSPDLLQHHQCGISFRGSIGHKGLNTAIKKLRYVLGDSAENPIFIETIPRAGYRFIAPISGEAKETGFPQPSEHTLEKLVLLIDGDYTQNPSKSFILSPRDTLSTQIFIIS